LTSRAAVVLKARFGGRDLGGAGAWLRDERRADDGMRQVSVNVRRVGAGGRLEGIRLFEYDSERRLRTRLQARNGAIDPEHGWLLEQVVLTQWSVPQRTPLAGPDARGPEVPQEASRVEETRHDTLSWPTALSEEVVAAAVLPPSSMSTLDLWRYSTHLSDREQSSARYAIQFWKKALYPFACLVMVALALPFAYLSARAGGISLKVFGGIMLGISFVLLNSVSGHLGVLRDWTPWMAAAVPSLVYILMSMAAFAWLVRYR
jgi:lipopolysaccharide export system permease protein